MSRRAPGGRSSKVVDLNEFRARRARAAQSAPAAALPLFDGEAAPAEPAPPIDAAALAAAAHLSDRQVRHRERMLRFLATGQSG